jgi:triacylglycerol lipase
VRAPELWKHVLDVKRQTGAPKVNLVCHSLGGLDCRYLASPGGLALDIGVDAASSIASITTVGTAHRGTRIADVLLGAIPDEDRGAAIDHFATLVGDWFSPDALASDAHVRESLQALSLANAPAFDAAIVDAPGVYYQSWAGYSRPFGAASAAHDARLHALCVSDVSGEDGLFGMGHDYMALTLAPFTDTVGRVDGNAEPEPNDGLTTVSSAKWGTFRGCVPADHMEQLGQKNLPDVNVRTGFDVARFYANIAGDLAARGF